MNATGIVHRVNEETPMKISKKEVEALLKNKIEDSLFAQALSYAKSKQKYIFSIDPRPVVMQDWYLIQLTAEYAVSLSFSHFTMDVCKMLDSMEKEHPVNDQSAPTNSHIVTWFCK